MDRTRLSDALAVEAREWHIRKTTNAKDYAEDIDGLSKLLSDGWEIKGYLLDSPDGRYVLLTRGLRPS
jgi:hypothetical protein